MGILNVNKIDSNIRDVCLDDVTGKVHSIAYEPMSLAAGSWPISGL